MTNSIAFASSMRVGNCTAPNLRLYDHEILLHYICNMHNQMPLYEHGVGSLEPKCILRGMSGG